MPPTGPSLVLLALLALLTARPVSPAVQSRGDAPNIILILSDDHRWDGIGAAGNPAVHTPVLDRLAREGVYFRQGTVHVPQCSPSRATLLTGLPPHRHGYYSNQHQRPGVRSRDGFGVPAMPALLRAAGYRTLLAGKWHVAQDPWECGFSDVRTWLPGGGGPFRDPLLARGRSRELRVRDGYTNELFADDAVAFIRNEASRDKPFFLWLAFTAPHLPMRPNPERMEQLYAGKSAADLAPPGFPAGMETRGGDWADYYASISLLDVQIGRLLQALDESRAASNTVVAFIGDNGYMMGSRGWNGKVVPYEESIRIPFLVRAPRIQTTAGTSDAAVSSLDLPATFLSLAGVPVPAGWPGRDLTPLLRGESKGFEDAVCEWSDDQSAQFGDLGYRVLRTSSHKLIRWQRPARPEELYDLKADPRETKNLAEEPSAALIRLRLTRRLNDWMRENEDPALNWK